MKGRKRLIIALTGLVGWANYASSQVPGIPGGAPGFPGAGLPGIAPGPSLPTAPKTLWGFLGLGKEQKEFCLRKLCKTPLGQLLNNSTAPLQALSGGLIPPFCPMTPTLMDLADPGAVGAASKIMLDEAQAKARRAAVRYLGTVDCHYWPEAEEGLIGALRGDRNECVRYEAALALGSGCCCTKKTMEALTIVVSCSDRDGAPKENSERVLAASRMALDHCMACFKAPAPPVKPPKPVPEGEAEGEKDKEKDKDKKDATTPPVTPPVTNDAGDVKPASAIVLGEAKPFAPPVEAKPLFHGGVMQAVAKTTKPATRPVGFDYYALIAQTPMAPILAEARRVAAAVPLPASQLGDRSLVALIENAKVVPASEKVETGERIAEVVSERPANLWDMMAANAKPAKPAATTTTIVKVTQQPPMVLPQAMESPPLVMPAAPISEPKPAVTPVTSMPVEPKPMPTPAPTPVASTAIEIKPAPSPVPAQAPPASIAIENKPMPMQPIAPLPAPAKLNDHTVKSGLLIRPLSPFNATRIEKQPPRPLYTPAEPAKPKPTVTPVATSVEAPATKTVFTASPVTKTVENPASKTVVTASLSDRPTCAPCTAKSNVKAECTTCIEQSLPVPVAHTMPMPALPTLPISPPKPAVVEPATPTVASDRAQKVLVLLHNAAATDERLQAICDLDAADLASSDDLVDKLLSRARRSKDEMERKACIQAMVRGKVAQPEVFATLSVLSKDTVPSVRVEATIGLARLRLASAQ